MVRRRVIVHGQVQGVFFRDRCRQEAHAAEVAGWVRNTADGAVEAVFEGSEEAVDALCAWCRRGPSSADVTGVDVHEEESQGLRGFEIRP